jgi:osmotically-inducible protein OsmY
MRHGYRPAGPGDIESNARVHAAHRDPRNVQAQRLRTGPKNFQRSDQRLREDVSERLMFRDDVDSSDVTVEVKDGIVTLDGTVPERWMRYAMDDEAESVLGVREVANRVRVRRPNAESTGRAELMGQTRRFS